MQMYQNVYTTNKRILGMNAGEETRQVQLKVQAAKKVTEVRCRHV